MDELLTSIAAKKKRLDELRLLSQKALAKLEHYYGCSPQRRSLIFSVRS
jgi:hypothetical protein